MRQADMENVGGQTTGRHREDMIQADMQGRGRRREYMR